MAKTLKNKLRAEVSLDKTSLTKIYTAKTAIDPNIPVVVPSKIKEEKIIINHTHPISTVFLLNNKKAKTNNCETPISFWATKNEVVPKTHLPYVSNPIPVKKEKRIQLATTWPYLFKIRCK
ncbi:hypothetical protein [Allomuricauda sp.]|uniref:hypothetical protein n=1 Tax=Flagellimonas alginolytica TaxID=3177515 RepID=UPI0025EA4251|nr:hypothetical protein [Allomuricauda sp.]